MTAPTTGLSRPVAAMTGVLAAGRSSGTAEARATDRSGYTQTDQRAQVIPNGATEWPSVGFTVG